MVNLPHKIFFIKLFFISDRLIYFDNEIIPCHQANSSHNYVIDLSSKAIDFDF
jgi:hypothetical protein